MNEIYNLLISFISWFKSPKKYNNTFQSFNEQGNVNPGNCAELTFINQGTSKVMINQHVTLKPESFIGFDGKANEQDTTIYFFTFDNTGDNNLVVIRKFYNV